LDKIFVPVHLGTHWCLAVIDTVAKEICYYDSLLGHNKHCLDCLRKYLSDEAKNKRNELLDLQLWQEVHKTDIPKQLNGYDCGMFMLLYIDRLVHELPLDFSQKDVSKYRQRLMLTILHAK